MPVFLSHPLIFIISFYILYNNKINLPNKQAHNNFIMLFLLFSKKNKNSLIILINFKTRMKFK